jgi:hypothetical protein
MTEEPEELAQDLILPSEEVEEVEQEPPVLVVMVLKVVVL